MGKRIVIALGGNALGNNLPEQMAAVKHTAKAIVDLIEEGHQVVVAHGNGPQVGMINMAMTTLSREDPTPSHRSHVRLHRHEPGLYRLRPAELPAGGAAEPGHPQAGGHRPHPGGGGPGGPGLPEPLQAHRHLYDRGGGGGDAPPGQLRHGGRRPGLAPVRGLPQAQGHCGDRDHPHADGGGPGGHRLRRRRHPRLPDGGQPPEGRRRRHRQGLRLRAAGGAAWTRTPSSSSPPWRRWPSTSASRTRSGWIT